MPATRASTAAADMQLPSVIISDTSAKDIEWDGNPLTRPVWLSTLPTLLEEDKSIRDFFEKGWVLTSSGKVAVEFAIHARYISLFPDTFFEWEDPAPTFNVAVYELRRAQLMDTLDKWHAAKSAGEFQPFSLSFYDPSNPSAKPKSYDEVHEDNKTEYDKMALPI